MNKNKFSVLLSVYYKENPDYLRESLNSIFEQTVMPDEVLLVEDGKLTDQLDEVIAYFEKKYSGIMKVLKFEKNRGLGSALHDGILSCKNDLVFRMDTDDICLKNRFEKQLKIFETKNVDVVGTNITEFDEEMKHETGKRIVPETNEQIKISVKKRNPINHMTVAFKKQAVLDSGNYQDMLYFEDYYLWARMISKGYTFYNVQEELVNVRGGNDMIKRRGGKKYIKPIIKFQKAILDVKIINKFEYCCNVFKRIIGALIPNSLRFIIYKKALRK